MDDIDKTIEEKWNDRLKTLLDKWGLSQKELVKQLNEKYGTSCNQRDVSRWINVGSSRKKDNPVGFPTFKKVIMIADFFNVDISYLIGKIECKTLTNQDICDIIGCSESVLESLIDGYSKHNHHSKTGLFNFEAKQILDKLLSNDEFFELIHVLNYLENIKFEKIKLAKVYDTYTKEFSKETLDEAHKIISDPYSDCSSSSPNEHPKEVIDAIIAIEKAHDKEYELSQKIDYDTDIYRYRAQIAFSKLLDSLYPR